MVPDLDALRRKLANPPAGLDGRSTGLQTQLEEDAKFRGPNIYPALGDVAAQSEANAGAGRGTIAARITTTSSAATWCSAAPAVHQSVYFSTGWTVTGCGWPSAGGAGLLHFGYVHCVGNSPSAVPHGGQPVHVHVPILR